MNKHSKYAGVAALAAVAIIITGGVAYGFYAPANALSVTDAKLNSIYMLRNASGVGMNVSFRLSNPSSNNLVLKKVTYYVTVDGAQVGKVAEQKNLVLSPSTSKEITLQIKVTDNNTLTHIINSLQKGIVNLGVTVKGKIPIKWYGIAEFSAKETSAKTTSAVNVSQILAKEENEAVRTTSTNHHVVRSNEPIIQVLSVKWYVKGYQVTEVKSGTEVTLYVLVKALKDLKNTQINAYIISDYKIFPDSTYKIMYTYLQLKKGQTGLYLFSFKAKHHWLLRGYYAKITITTRIVVGTEPATPVETVYYEMPNHYPPRLKVTK